MVKKCNGRRKIEMVKMANEKNLRVTFSKRKSGLFKKASELCTLCDAKVALSVISPSGKFFSFSHPNVDVLSDHLSRRSQDSFLSHSHNTQVVESNTNSDLQVLYQVLDQALVGKGKEKENNKKYKIIQNERLNNSDNWSQKAPEELSLTQAIHMKHVAEDLKKKIDDLHSQFQQSLIPHQNYYVGSSDNVAPGGVHRGDNYTTHNLFDQYSGLGTNRSSYDPNMATPSQWLLFGYNHDNNNISERIVPDSTENRTP